MTTFQIREELANRYNLEIRNVCCYHCEYWGYNRGKVLNSVGESKCMKRKNERTWCRQFCRGFVPKSGK
jgi:hypothetical protein